LNARTCRQAGDCAAVAIGLLACGSSTLFPFEEFLRRLFFFPPPPCTHSLADSPSIKAKVQHVKCICVSPHALPDTTAPLWSDATRPTRLVSRHVQENSKQSTRLHNALGCNCNCKHLGSRFRFSSRRTSGRLVCWYSAGLGHLSLG